MEKVNPRHVIDNNMLNWMAAWHAKQKGYGLRTQNFKFYSDKLNLKCSRNIETYFPNWSKLNFIHHHHSNFDSMGRHFHAFESRFPRIPFQFSNHLQMNFRIDIIKGQMKHEQDPHQDPKYKQVEPFLPFKMFFSYCIIWFAVCRTSMPNTFTVFIESLLCKY